MKSPYEIILENGSYCYADSEESRTKRICDALQREGWYFTWCEQKYLREKENQNVK